MVIAGATDIASVPLQIQYDPAKLSLVNVDNGDFLNQRRAGCGAGAPRRRAGHDHDQRLAPAGSSRE